MNVENFSDCLELDELYWFIECKTKTETRENVYIMTAVYLTDFLIIRIIFKKSLV